MKRAALLLPLLALGGAAHAQEFYAQGGFLGGFAGVGIKLSDRVGIRTDLGTAGRRTYDTTEEGIRYQARFHSARAGFFGDWFPGETSTFRLTAGVVASDYRWALSADGSSGSLTIGNTTYLTSGADRLEATLRLPRTAPYVGVGWGHRGGGGFRFVADIGASYGRGKVTLKATGPLAAQVQQADLDRETAELRDAVSFLRWMPQITFGAGWSF